ncbi:beta-1,4-N-acetylgalactosaminyltransferase bre-4-like [Hydractinia symbiolongicarpus]|uniref:beta-1,4-N-acetylgalactosaminyltransferase bre-4-like n=1 Tax=Hydractinia symbiolongicarpus TaxID=13093 RepID=UPI002550D7BE|nr:beta-1,4-N-acetylgalactosaminyltransferase bre-4-like [Hydractinia symbiolongicarpus]
MLIVRRHSMEKTLKYFLNFLLGFMFCMLILWSENIRNCSLENIYVKCCNGSIKHVRKKFPEHKHNNNIRKDKKEEERKLVGVCSGDFKRWHQRDDRYDNQEEIKTYHGIHCNSSVKTTCISDTLVGPLHVHKERITLDWLHETELSFVNNGGWWSPVDCHEKQQTAIVIPFRDREEHLAILLRQLHPILYRNNLHYRIFVIEQSDNYTFNRAKLMNVGYQEAGKYFPYSCFVFHDVDLIPENDRINYACKHSPMHLSVGIDKFRYILTYPELFGGIEMFLSQDFKRINGFSNSFWNWGAEDDNLYRRCKKHNLTIHRQSIQIARYTMLKHHDNRDNAPPHDVRTSFLRNSLNYFVQDGLGNLQYDLIDRIEHSLFTLIKVDLRKDRDKLFGVGEFPR